MVSDLVADPIHTVGLALCRFVLICLVCFDFVLHCSNPRSCSLLQPAFAGCCSISINFCTYYTIFQSVQVASIQYTQHTPSYSMSVLFPCSLPFWSPRWIDLVSARRSSLPKLNMPICHSAYRVPVGGV